MDKRYWENELAILLLLPFLIFCLYLWHWACIQHGFYSNSHYQVMFRHWFNHSYSVPTFLGTYDHEQTTITEGLVNDSHLESRQPWAPESVWSVIQLAKHCYSCNERDWISFVVLTLLDGQYFCLQWVKAKFWAQTLGMIQFFLGYWLWLHFPS